MPLQDPLEQLNPSSTDKKTKANNRPVEDRVGDAFDSLKQSGQDFTGRVAKGYDDYGLAGAAINVGKEIAGGLGQLGELGNEKVVQPLAQLAIGQKGIDAISPGAVNAKGRAQSDPAIVAPSLAVDNAQNPALATESNSRLSDPAIANQAVAAAPIGLNGVAPPPAPNRGFAGTNTRPSDAFVEQGNANIRARRAAQGEGFQNSFNDQNYQPARIADPSVATGGGSTPAQDQLKQKQIQDLVAVATRPIDNNLSYDKRKTLAREQKAAQSVLGTLVGADTADKNRASDYQADKNQATIKQQQDEAKAAEKKSGEASFFSGDDLAFADIDLTDDELLNLGTISKSDGQKLRNYFAKTSADELRARLQRGELDRYGVKGDRLLTVFGAGHKIGG